MPFTTNARNKLLDNVFKGTQWTGAGSPSVDVGRLVIQLSSTPINADGSGRTAVGTAQQLPISGTGWAAVSGGQTNLISNYTLTSSAIPAVSAVTIQSNLGGPVIYYYNFPVTRENFAGETIRVGTPFKLRIE